MKNHVRVSGLIGVLIFVVIVVVGGANLIGLLKTEIMESIFRVLFPFFGLYFVVFSRVLAEKAERDYNANPQWFKRVFGPPTFLTSSGFVLWVYRIFGTLFFIVGVLSFLKSGK